jgi:hypothetical protein
MFIDDSFVLLRIIIIVTTHWPLKLNWPNDIATTTRFDSF